MRSLKLLCALILMLTCSLLSGCGRAGGSLISLGPQVRTEYVLVHPGRPMTALENKAVKGRVLDGSGDPVIQDVGGWVMMPPDHWDVVKRALDGAQK